MEFYLTIVYILAKTTLLCSLTLKANCFSNHSNTLTIKEQIYVTKCLYMHT